MDSFPKRCEKALNLSNFLHDKHILMVGNSVDLLKYRCGKWIDGFDVVIRFNRIYNELPRFETELGNKTDILATARPVERLLIGYHDIDWLLWTTDEQEMEKRCPKLMTKYSERYYALNQFWRKSYKEQNGVWPTTGAVVFEWLDFNLENGNIKSLNLIGFDFFESASIVTGLNQASKWHNPEIEKEYVLGKAKANKGIKLWQTKTSTDLATPTLLTV